jgi:hypothetical protein
MDCVGEVEPAELALAVALDELLALAEPLPLAALDEPPTMAVVLDAPPVAADPPPPLVPVDALDAAADVAVVVARAGT